MSTNDTTAADRGSECNDLLGPPPWADDVEAWLEVRNANEIADDIARYTRAEVARAVAAERERPRQVIAYMATNREGEMRFTDNPDAARELEGYGWAITPLADAGPNK